MGREMGGRVKREGIYVYLQLWIPSLSPIKLTVSSSKHAHTHTTFEKKKKYWSGLPCPPPWSLSDPGIEPVSLKSPAMAGGFFTTSTTWETVSSVNSNYLNPPHHLTVRSSFGPEPVTMDGSQDYVN